MIRLDVIEKYRLKNQTFSKFECKCFDFFFTQIKSVDCVRVWLSGIIIIRKLLYYLSYYTLYYVCDSSYLCLYLFLIVGSRNAYQNKKWYRQNIVDLIFKARRKCFHLYVIFTDFLILYFDRNFVMNECVIRLSPPLEIPLCVKCMRHTESGISLDYSMLITHKIQIIPICKNLM